MTVFFWCFVVSVAIQCGYALYFFRRIFDIPSNKTEIATANTPVSVLICAKDEARNLEQNLPSILAQRYKNESGKPMYEVIVINDASEDDTEQVLYHLEQQYSHLWHVTISKDEERMFKGKKFALSTGIAYATHPWLLLTDADCTPASENWLACMIAPLAKGKEIVVGYGGYTTLPGFLNAFIRWETMHTFLQYGTYTLAGKPYMAVGRNLACTKDIFLKAQQSAIWNKLPSGDDDLLMQCCATGDNTAIVAYPEAFTFSNPKTTWRTWLAQKQRHLSTGKYYNDEIQALLGMYATTHAATWLLFFILLTSKIWMLALVIMVMRCAVCWTIWRATANKLQNKNLLSWFPFCDIGWMLYNFVLSPYILWKNKQQWK